MLSGMTIIGTLYELENSSTVIPNSLMPSRYFSQISFDPARIGWRVHNLSLADEDGEVTAVLNRIETQRNSRVMAYVAKFRFILLSEIKMFSPVPMNLQTAIHAMRRV